MQRVAIDRDKLTQADEHVRRALFLVGHYANEVTIYRRFLLMANNYDDQKSDLRKSVKALQQFSLIRTLSAKIYDYWTTRSQGNDATRYLVTEVEPKLDDDVQKILAYLKGYFGKKSMIQHFRNKLSSHADQSEIEKSLKLILFDKDTPIYASNRLNSAFQHASMPINLSMMTYYDEEDVWGSFGKVLEEVIEISSQVDDYLWATIATIVNDIDADAMDKPVTLNVQAGFDGDTHPLPPLLDPVD